MSSGPSQPTNGVSNSKSETGCYYCVYRKSSDLDSDTDNSLDSSYDYYCCFCADPQDNDSHVFCNRWANRACQIFNCFSKKSKCCGTHFEVKEDQWDLLEPNLSRFFNSLVDIYFWVLAAVIVGVMLFIASFYTIGNSNPALVACDSPFESYYMCPTCSKGCDFWYFKQLPFNLIPCTRRFRLLLDNPIIWTYCLLVLVGALVTTCCIVFKKEPDRKNYPCSCYFCNKFGCCNQTCLCIPCLENDNTVREENGEDKNTLGRICESSTVMFFVTIGSLGVYIGSFFALIAVEQKLRLHFHDHSGNFTFLYYTLVVAFAVGDSVVKWRVREKCKYLIGEKIKVTPSCYFVLFWVSNSFTSYFPVLFKIYLYGNIVRNPEEGYLHVGQLRFKHCLQYGCIDAVVYLVVVIFICHIVLPLLSAFWEKLKKSCSRCWCCCCWCYNKPKEKDRCNICCVNLKSGENCKKLKSCYNTLKSCYNKLKSCCNIPYEKLKSCITRCNIQFGCCNSCCNNKTEASNCEIADKYVEFTVLYGYIIFFITVAGVFPLLIALVSVPLTCLIAAASYPDKPNTENSSTAQEPSDTEVQRGDDVHYGSTLRPMGNREEQKKMNQLKKEASCLYNIWKKVLLGMTLFSMFTNIAHVIPNSRFLQHVSYSTSTGYHHSTLDLQGYLDIALPNHSLFRLIEIGAFPNYNAHYLPEKYIRGNNKMDSDGEDILYLPFVDFDCLKEMNSSYEKDYFTRGSYINYIRNNRYNNYIMEYNDKKHAIEPGPCFIDYHCRSRGILKNTEQGKRLQTVRSAFCSTFILSVAAIVVVIVIACKIKRNANTGTRSTSMQVLETSGGVDASTDENEPLFQIRD